MPFLPSEGEETKLIIDGELKDVLVFHYLPILWYRYPIPNEIREFWYYKRLDILTYMQKAYKDLDIQFLPDGIAREIRNQSFSTKLFSTYDFLLIQDNKDSISIDISIAENLIQILNKINFLN